MGLLYCSKYLVLIGCKLWCSPLHLHPHAAETRATPTSFKRDHPLYNVGSNHSIHLVRGANPELSLTRFMQPDTLTAGSGTRVGSSNGGRKRLILHSKYMGTPRPNAWKTSTFHTPHQPFTSPPPPHFRKGNVATPMTFCMFEAVPTWRVRYSRWRGKSYRCGFSFPNKK